MKFESKGKNDLLLDESILSGGTSGGKSGTDHASESVDILSDKDLSQLKEDNLFFSFVKKIPRTIKGKKDSKKYILRERYGKFENDDFKRNISVEIRNVLKF